MFKLVVGIIIGIFIGLYFPDQVLELIETLKQMMNGAEVVPTKQFLTCLELRVLNLCFDEIDKSRKHGR